MKLVCVYEHDPTLRLCEPTSKVHYSCSSFWTWSIQRPDTMARRNTLHCQSNITCNTYLLSIFNLARSHRPEVKPLEDCVRELNTKPLIVLLVYFPYFEKNERPLVRLPRCPCVCQNITNQSVGRSGTLVLAFASTVSLGFGSRRNA
jgi:hypothetical protein